MDSNQVSLLLVDDDPLNLILLGNDLEEACFHTVTAGQGEGAWELLQQDPHQFQAVLLDRMMPGMDGMAVLAQIKTHASLNRLPVIRQTAAASFDEIREGIEAGTFLPDQTLYEGGHVGHCTGCGARLHQAPVHTT